MNSCVDLLSPPAWWCGLKSSKKITVKELYKVTTCVVVWIEMTFCHAVQFNFGVTTCVVVWIEMPSGESLYLVYGVTTCVVVWIEIAKSSSP